MRSRHQAACASERLYVFQPSTCSGRIRGNDIKGHARDKSTERTKCTLALSAMVTGAQFWQRVTEITRSPPSSDRTVIGCWTRWHGRDTSTATATGTATVSVAAGCVAYTPP